MTVETTDRKESFAGGQTTLTFSFKVLPSHPEHVKVLAVTSGTETLLTYTSEYTVSLNSDGVGGTVTLNPTFSTAYTHTVYRDTTKTQTTDYDDYNQFPADTLEGDLDRAMCLSQESDEDIDRSIKIPVSSALTGSALQITVSGGTVIGFNAAGTAIQGYPEPSASVTACTNYATSAATSATLAGNYATTSSTNATLAGNYATSASTSATSAATSATTCLNAVTTATNLVTTANTLLTTATNYISTMSTLVTSATTQATLAGNYATTASTEAALAAGHATSAQNWSNTASTQATLAGNYATSASTSATEASNYATSASTSATLAGNYATSASTSAVLAGNYATSAATSAAIIPTPSGGTAGLSVVVNGTEDGYILDAATAGGRATFDNTAITNGTLLITYGSTVASPFTGQFTVADSNSTMVIPAGVTFAATAATFDMTSYLPISGNWSYHYVI
jgi:hypothetical protein